MSTRDDLIAVAARALDDANPWGDKIASEYAAAAVIDALGIEQVAALLAGSSGEVGRGGESVVFPCSPVFRIRALEPVASVVERSGEA